MTRPPASPSPSPSSRTMRVWHWVHTWSSLICTAFLLLLCVTGLPLIFHDEIDALTDGSPEQPASVQAGAMNGSAGTADLDHIVAEVVRRYPGERVQYLIWSDDGPNLLKVNLAPPRGVARGNRLVAVDGLSGQILGTTWSQKDWRHGNLMTVLLALHTNLLIGTTGSLLFCMMGLLFVVALVSGTVLYGHDGLFTRLGALPQPSTAKTCRAGRSRTSTPTGC